MEVFVDVHAYVADIGNDPYHPVLEVLTGHHPLTEQTGRRQCRIHITQTSIGVAVEQKAPGQGSSGKQNHEQSVEFRGCTAHGQRLMVLSAIHPHPPAVNTRKEVVSLQAHIRVQLGFQKNEGIQHRIDDAQYPPPHVLLGIEVHADCPRHEAQNFQRRSSEAGHGQGMIQPVGHLVNGEWIILLKRNFFF